MITLDDRWGFRHVQVRVPCPALPRPLRILHLSDSHLMPHDRAKQAFIRRMTALEHDFVFFTGDVTETQAAELLVPGLLSRQPTYGAYVVFGNHDHLRMPKRWMLQEMLLQRFYGNGTQSDPQAMKVRFEGEGKWQVLINEARAHDVDGKRVVVVGVDDPFTGAGDLQIAMHHVKQADVLIGLVHVPTDLASFAQRGFHLVLSGHTHGGQIRIPFYGAMVTQCDLPRAKAAGLHYVERTAVHVSQGLGAGKLIRMRLNCAPTAYTILLGG